MVSESLLQRIRCPVTRESLIPATAAAVEVLNEEVRAGRLFNQLGIQIESGIQQGLVNESLTCFIMVNQGIPDLSPDQTIPIDHLEFFEPN